VATVRPVAGDVAVTRTEHSGETTYAAIVIPASPDTPALPDGTKQLLRIQTPSPELAPAAIAAAINAVAATGWPQGSRGNLDLERAASYIRVPLSEANESGLQAALHLRQQLEPLLTKLADPSHWT